MRILKNSLTKYFFIFCLFCAVAFGIFRYYVAYSDNDSPIKVGVLHALSGTMAISEKSVAEATLLAIEELNAKGGLLGRKIEPIVIDTKSDWAYAAKMSEKLILEDKVCVVFGCWTSACRKTVKPIFEKHKHLLFYPVQYEGLESSPNIVYTGASPNQQIIPATKWAFDNIGKRFFLVGSDYIFPRIANELIKKQIEILGGQLLGEEYLLLGSKDVTGIIEKIKRTKPDVILNTINGDSNVAFFSALKEAKITAHDIPVMSFSIAEDELNSFNIENMVDHYATWNYFQSITTDENKKFVEVFKKRYGPERVTDDPMEAGYFGVYLWAQAVEDSKNEAVTEVIKNIRKQSFNAPEGNISIEPTNQHTWKTVRVGTVNKHGQFDVVWSSEKPIQPVPYISYKTKEEWESFLNSFYKQWGDSWSNSAEHEKSLDGEKDTKAVNH